MGESSGRARRAPGAAFATTRWTLVTTAAGTDTLAARKALAELCRTYWYPLYAFVRRGGHSAGDAEDLTQAFFARLLEKNDVARADRARGRFRTFLLAAMKHFLANEYDRAHAAKRGGGHKIVFFDEQTAETRYARTGGGEMTPEALFDRAWAASLLRNVMAELRDEYVGRGRGELFDRLRGLLADEPAGASSAQLAAELGLTGTALRVAVHRMRGRYRRKLRQAIADTVAGPEEVDDEIRRLFEAFD